MRKPYAEWEVKGDTYQLKLTTSAVIKLEEQFNTNLLNTIMGNGMPALSIMLKTTHQAMQKFHHGIKLDKVYELFDDFCDEGGSQIEFFTGVFMPLFRASGFLSENQGEVMDTHLEKIKEEI